ncbi:MAG: hypothetical protein IH584_01235 [Candidatus Aminicenantes bacterium]|nr:hypothetical protein [Candidatus Aminicenantes bacterium]
MNGTGADKNSAAAIARRSMALKEFWQIPKMPLRAILKLGHHIKNKKVMIY